MKLEAVDRKNPSLVCVATLADIVEDRLLVHFDNWDDSYDYWWDTQCAFYFRVFMSDAKNLFSFKYCRCSYCS